MISFLIFSSSLRSAGLIPALSVFAGFFSFFVRLFFCLRLLSFRFFLLYLWCLVHLLDKETVLRLFTFQNLLRINVLLVIFYRFHLFLFFGSRLLVVLAR